MSRPFKGFSSPSQVSSRTNRKWKKRLLFGLAFFVGSQLYTQNYNIELEYIMDPSKKNFEIIQNCSDFKAGHFKPCFYLPTAFMQIIYGAKFDPTPYVPFEREYLKLADQGQIGLDWGPIHKIFEKDDPETMRILVITHGLTGGSETNYIRHAVLKASRHGFRPVVFHNRGINTELCTEKYHCNSSIADLSEILQHIKEKYPKAPIYGMGISMGANLLLNYAGQTKNECIFKGLVSISNPFDLYECGEQIDQWRNSLYNWNMTNGFKRNLKKNMDFLRKNEDKGIEIEKALQSWRTKDFDEYFTRRLFGYTDVEQYYKSIGCKDRVKNIQIPALLINSKDDPICNTKNIPYEDIKKNENLILVLTPRGGHIDWFTSIPPTRWVYSPALQYLTNLDNFYKEQESKKGN